MEFKTLAEQQEFFQNVLDCIHDRIYVTDAEGKIIMFNTAIERDCDTKHRKEDLIGRNMADLVKEGFMKESLTLKVIETKKAQGHIFHEPEGHDLLAWGTPFMKGGEMQFVVCTEWDMKALNTLRDYLSAGDADSPAAQTNLSYYSIKNTMPGVMVARSTAMRQLLETAALSARSDTTVLIQGESGTGKELLMRYIHFKGDRSNTPLIEINCGAVPENLMESEFFGYVKGAFTGADAKGKAGAFELADHGTLFLDEVDALSLNAQTKLLRVLQEKTITRVGGHVSTPVDVKIIAATNTDLKKLVKEKQFREDLYYRLNVLPLYIPPLRERTDDIPELVRHFTKIYNAKHYTDKIVSPKDMDLFISYRWPGNIRELQNIIERAFLTTHNNRIPRKTWIQLLTLPTTEGSDIIPADEERINLKEAVEAYEKSLILSYLPQYKNSRQFAEMLGVEKSTINRKMSKYDINRAK